MKYSKKNILTVGISGGSASGKTTVCQLLLAKLGKDNVTILGLDSYYNKKMTSSASSLPNYDSPDAFDSKLLTEQLIALKTGSSVNIPIYDYSVHDRLTETKPISASNILIVEGILLFHWEHIRSLLNLKVFITESDNLRLHRRLVRDQMERDRIQDSILKQWQNEVSPMHNKYCEPSKAYADLVTNSNDAVEEIVNLIEKYDRQN